MFMRRISAYLAMTLTLLCCTQAFAQANDDELIEGKEIWSQTKAEGETTSDGKNTYRHFDNRQAMAGRGYSVNTLAQSVGVATWISNLNNLTDEDLDNFVDIPNVVNVSVAVNPTVSVRSIDHYFDAGTEAGFCLVASSGDNVLSLDVIKMMRIVVYRDGQMIKTVDVEEGAEGSGIGLNLIKIPGSEDACTYITANIDVVFDEIALITGGGLGVGVGGTTRVKYAFVGSPKETKLIAGSNLGSGKVLDQVSAGNLKVQDDETLTFTELDGRNAVLLGLPFQFLDDGMRELVDDDSDNKKADGTPDPWTEFAAITPILSVGYQGGAKMCVRREGSEEAFKAGDEVGFKYINASAVDLGIGFTVTICLFDRHGNKIDEQTVSSGVLALAVADGGYSTVSVVANKDFSGAELRFYTGLALKLGAMGVCYGFVRQKPDVAHHCPINPTVSTNVCEEQTSYQLEANPDLSVSWSLVSQPDKAGATVTTSGRVTGMNAPGEYVFRATCMSCPTTPLCYEEITLNVADGLGEMDPDKCGTPTVNNELNGEIYQLGWSTDGEGDGALISIDDIKNSSNIINDELNDCATYIGGLGLANNLHIIGVKRNDGGLIYDGAEQKAKAKVGFVVEMTSTGLDLSALEFFQIRCYHGGKEVYRNVVKESNTVSVGLAGSNKVQKVRFAIEVPPTDEDGNAIQFDEISLWKSGVLDLNLSETRIYYGFVQYDSETNDCDSPLACVTATVSSQSTGATINGNETQMAGAVGVANVINNISYLIDDDLNTAMTISNTVNVGGGQTIAVNMGRTLDFRHQLCLVVDNATYLAAIQVGNWIKVSTYLRGRATGDEFQEWNVLGVNVIGYGDKNIMVMQPKSSYDEVRIEIGIIVGALKIQKFYGLFLRGDIDNDGIPDCMDTESCETSIEGIEATDVCVGDVITIRGKGMGSTDYTIQLPEQGINNTFTTDQQGNFSQSFQLNRPGRYTMTFRDGSGMMMGQAPYTVHPLMTTWRTDAASTDWNEWNNWTDGTPYCCTDAVIPQGAAHYPVLDGTVAEGDEYCVQGIHFEPGSAVDRVYKLNYDRAWVEMELEPNRYYMLAAPLKHTYTGDMFVAADGQLPPYFTPLTDGTLKENRFDPQIYQRLWARTAPGKILGGDVSIDVDIEKTRWSRNFNALAFDYGSAQGETQAGNARHYNAFSLWVDNGSLPATQLFRFRFPKEHTKYNYYEDFSRNPIDGEYEGGDKDNIGRDGIYRFAYEDASDKNKTFSYVRTRPGTDGTNESTTDERTVYLSAEELTATLSSQETGGPAEEQACFAAANPFMSRIDVAAFLAANSGKVKSVKLYDGNTISTATLNGGTLLSTGGETAIQPMQGFFVEATDPEAKSLDVTFSGAMMSPGVAEPPTEGEAAVTAQAAGACTALRLSARRGAEVATTVVTMQGDASARTLIDNEASPRVAVFTVAGGKAYDIHPADGRTSIPIGLLTEGTDTLTLSFSAEGEADLADYELYDNATGTAYPLARPLTFSGMGTSIGRFELRLRDAGNGGADGTVTRLYVAAQNGKAIVRSSRPDITRLEAFGTNGAKTGDESFAGTPEASVAIGRGMSVVRVTLSGGDIRTFKVMH